MAAFRLASTDDQLLATLQWIGALSKRSATVLLSWSSPIWQEPAFLIDVLLTDFRCNPPGKQHVSHAASALLWLALYVLCFRANMSNFALSTPSAVLDLSYIMVTNFSKVPGLQHSLPVGTGWVCWRYQKPHHKHPRFAKQSSSLCHGMLKQHRSQWRHGRRASLCSFLQECNTSHLQDHTSGSVLGQRQPTTTADFAPKELAEHWMRWWQHLCLWLSWLSVVHNNGGSCKEVLWWNGLA